MMCIYKMVLNEGSVHDVYAHPDIGWEPEEVFDYLIGECVRTHHPPSNNIPYGTKGNFENGTPNHHRTGCSRTPDISQTD